MLDIRKIVLNMEIMRIEVKDGIDEKQIAERLGVPYWEMPPGCSPQYMEYIVAGGTLYERWECEYYKLVFFLAVPYHHADDDPDMLCQCGETRFEIRFGQYEVWARCECGCEDIIYAG